MHYTSICGSTSDPIILKEKGSQFWAYGFRCESEAAFERQLYELKKQHFNASHHCYGWRIYPQELKEFAQDDGEPSGTAGLPILNQMKSADLCNSAIVVVRYFGGTKLGKSGLIAAYGEAARQCIETLPKEQLQAGRAVNLRFDYPYKRKIDDIIALYDGIIAREVFTEHIAYTVHIPEKHAQSAAETFRKMEYLGIEVQEKEAVFMYS